MAICRRKLEASIAQQAWNDPAFNEVFIADANATIEKQSIQMLLLEARVFAHAKDGSTVHFVIPPKPANSDQLSEEDLEKIAGGIDVLVGISGAAPSPSSGLSPALVPITAGRVDCGEVDLLCEPRANGFEYG